MARRVAPGQVMYTLGWPLTSEEYGGAWIYGEKNNVASLGFVTGLDYGDPRIDCHRVLQVFKEHPMIRRLLDGGTMIRYGAKTFPYGGWWAVPPLAGSGWMILGDAAGLLNSQRLKGIHLAIKSGMLAAETIFHAMQNHDFSAGHLQEYARAVDNSWIKQELWGVRNFHQAFDHGLWRGLLHTVLQQVTGGRGIHARQAAIYRDAERRRVTRLEQRTPQRRRDN